MVKYFVLDTNILVSALVFKSQNPTEVLKYCRKNGMIVLSPKIKEEYWQKMLHEKFDAFSTMQLRKESLQLIESSCETIEPLESIKVCRDPSDDMFIELAVASNASAIVTGDKALLELHPFRGIPILIPADFLKIFLSI